MGLLFACLWEGVVLSSLPFSQEWRGVVSKGFPGGTDGKDLLCNAGDPGLIPGSGRSPEEENGISLQFSCLENPTDRGDWWALVHVVAESQA